MGGTVELECRDGFLSIQGVPEERSGWMVAYRLYIRFMEENRGGADDASRAMIPIRTRNVDTYIDGLQSSIDVSRKCIGSVVRMADCTDDLRYVSELSAEIFGITRNFILSMGGRIPTERREEILRDISVGESHLRGFRGLL
ncbi:MAG: hypothetical protein ACI38Y_06785 [Candidatus Methanomethylophilaceae archaeon]